MMAHDARSGLLIVFEGVDGSGKSTLARGLARALEEVGYEVVLTREPTDGPHGKEIRRLAAVGREEASPEEEYQLFQRDRREHVVTVVHPALSRGAVVVQDRSYFSTVAYQGDRGVDPARILADSEAIAPKPDLLFIVDVPAEEALERIRRTRKEIDDFERLESLERLRKVFLSFREGEVVDGREPPASVLSRVLEAVARRLPLLRASLTVDAEVTGRGPDPGADA